MNQEMKNRLLRLNPEALVEMIDAICGQMGMDFHFGQDPCDCIDNPIFYVYGGPNVGTFTVLNYDPVLHDKPKYKLVAELRDIDTNNHFANVAILNAADEIERLRSERDEAIIHANNIIREARTPIIAAGKHTGGYWDAVDNFRRFKPST